MKEKGIGHRPVLQRELDMSMITNEVLVDLTNGATTSEVLRKLQGGMYETPHYKDKCLSQKQAYNILRKAIDESESEVRQSKEALRSLTFQRYLSIYEDSVKSCDRSNAIKALDSMSKLLGLNAMPEAQTNIQLINKDGDVKINFGFNTDSVND